MSLSLEIDINVISLYEKNYVFTPENNNTIIIYDSQNANNTNYIVLNSPVKDNSIFFIYNISKSSNIEVRACNLHPIFMDKFHSLIILPGRIFSFTVNNNQSFKVSFNATRKFGLLSNRNLLLFNFFMDVSILKHFYDPQVNYPVHIIKTVKLPNILNDISIKHNNRVLYIQDDLDDDHVIDMNNNICEITTLIINNNNSIIRVHLPDDNLKINKVKIICLSQETKILPISKKEIIIPNGSIEHNSVIRFFLSTDDQWITI